MMRKYCLIFIILGIVSCSNNHSAILSINEMKPILWDMINADNWSLQRSILDTAREDKKNNILFYEKIFKQYDITRAQFYKSYKYYELHPAQMKILLDSVESYGTSEKMNLDKPHAKTTKK